MKRCGVAIVGCGTVGSATARHILDKRADLAKRSGVELDLKYLVDVDFRRADEAGLPASLHCTDLAKVLGDSGVEIVVELIGGTKIARDVITRALSAGKHVVTANKALLAGHGRELCAIAREKGVSLSFEASCAGGIPVIRMLYDGLLANRIDAIYGILNGTCNFILTEMIEEELTFAQALAQAQACGLAEADPTLDISGQDTAHKIAILASLAFGVQIDLKNIPVEGIDTLDRTDVAFGRELGYTAKLLAIARREEDGISTQVRPVFIHRDHPLAWVSGPFNAVSVYGDAVGHAMFYGRGAGGRPTASAVTADILSVALGTTPLVFGQTSIWPDRGEAALPYPTDKVKSRYYLRIMCEDKAGALAEITAILGRRGISLSSVLQKELPDDAPVRDVVPVVATTQEAPQGEVRRALDEIDALEVVRGKSVAIAIIDEHEEGQ